MKCLPHLHDLSAVNVLYTLRSRYPKQVPNASSPPFLPGLHSIWTVYIHSAPQLHSHWYTTLLPGSMTISPDTNTPIPYFYDRIPKYLKSLLRYYHVSCTTTGPLYFNPCSLHVYILHTYYELQSWLTSPSSLVLTTLSGSWYRSAHF